MKILGSIIGDIAASPYFPPFFTRKPSNLNFEIFSEESHTGNTAMTLAIAKALLKCKPDFSNLAEMAEKCMRDMRIGPCLWKIFKYPLLYHPLLYGDIVSAVSPVAYAAKSLEECERLAYAVTPREEDYPTYSDEAAKAAGCVYLALHGAKKDEIRDYVYGLKRAKTVAAFSNVTSFLKSKNFESAVRNAVFMDDEGAVAAIAGAFYGVPDDIAEKAFGYLDDTEKQIMKEFAERYM